MELDGLRVNHHGLDQVADDLIGVVNRIDARMHHLDEELAPLRSQWVGEAQQAYTVAKARWDGAIHEMRDLLRSTSQQVSQANADYRAADARGARSFGG
jgi:early secretory antigenic target protein ESAT-6